MATGSPAARTFSLPAAALVIGRNLPSVIQMQSQSEAEFLAAANEMHNSGSHPASDRDLKRQSAVWDALSQVLLRCVPSRAAKHAAKSKRGQHSQSIEP